MPLKQIYKFKIVSYITQYSVNLNNRLVWYSNVRKVPVRDSGEQHTTHPQTNKHLPIAIKQTASGNSLPAASHAAETASGSHATTQAFIKCALNIN